MHRIVALKNPLASVGQGSVPKQKALTAQSKIFAMIFRNCVSNKRSANSIEVAVPSIATERSAQFKSTVDFSVGEGLVVAFIPTPTSKQSDALGNLLLDVDSEAILDAALLTARLNVRNSCSTGFEDIDRFAIAAHVRVICISEQPYDARALAHEAMSNLELEVFAASATQVPVQLDAVGYLRHKALGETPGQIVSAGV